MDGESKDFIGSRLDGGCNAWGAEAVVQVPEFIKIDLVGTLATKKRLGRLTWDIRDPVRL